MTTKSTAAKSAKSTATKAASTKAAPKAPESTEQVKAKPTRIERLVAAVTRQHAATVKRSNAIAAWSSDDPEQQAILGGIVVTLNGTANELQATLIGLHNLPVDFKPVRKNVSGIEAGDVVVIRDTKQKKNRLALGDDVTSELVVTKVDNEAKMMMATTEDGTRWIGPIADVKRA